MERAQLPVQETEMKMGDRERRNEGGNSRILVFTPVYYKIYIARE